MANFSDFNFTLDSNFSIYDVEDSVNENVHQISYIIKTALIVFILLVAFISNIFIMVGLCRIPKKTLTDVLVINLMAIDLLMCLYTAIYTVGIPFNYMNPLLASFVCKITGALGEFQTFPEAITLCAVAVDRYLALTRNRPEPKKTWLLLLWFLFLGIVFFGTFQFGIAHVDVPGDQYYCVTRAHFFIMEIIPIIVNFITIYIITLIFIVIVASKLPRRAPGGAAKHRWFPKSLWRVYVYFLIVFLPLQLFYWSYILFPSFLNITPYIITIWDYVHVYFVTHLAINPFLFMWFCVRSWKEFNHVRKYGTLGEETADVRMDGIEKYGTLKEQ